MSTEIIMWRYPDGEPVRVKVKDMGVRRWKGYECYVTRFEIEGRKRAVISRCDRFVIDRDRAPQAMRESVDVAALKSAGIAY